MSLLVQGAFNLEKNPQQCCQQSSSTSPWAVLIFRCNDRMVSSTVLRDTFKVCAISQADWPSVLKVMFFNTYLISSCYNMNSSRYHIGLYTDVYQPDWHNTFDRHTREVEIISGDNLMKLMERMFCTLLPVIKVKCGNLTYKTYIKQTYCDIIPYMFNHSFDAISEWNIKVCSVVKLLNTAKYIFLLFSKKVTL